ncbi:MAG: RDD family protein [Candidatus Kariarchaeaceae archaeon]
MIRKQTINPANRVELYLKDIEKYLPYGKEKNNELLDQVREDLLESQDIETDPRIVYGEPRTVARNIASLKVAELETAGWVKRFFAFSIDMILATFTAILLLIPAFYIFPDLEEQVKHLENNTLGSINNTAVLVGLIFFILYMITIFAFCASYIIWVEKIYATSIGKKLFGFRVIDETGIKITWKQSFIRNISKLQGEFLPLDVIIGLLMEKEEKKKRRATEIASETRVVKMR